MKRILRVAGLALLGLSIAGYATYVLGQPPAPVSLPGTPSLPTPVAPTLPNPVVPLAPTPGGTTLPVPVSPSKPADVIPIPGGAQVTPVKPGAVLPDVKPGAITIPGAATPNDAQPTPAQPAVADDNPGVSEPNPTGRQEPAVSLEWIGPAAAKVGQAADYTIVIRNVCNIAVQQVLVRVRLPEGITVAATEPKAVSEDSVLMWEVGTMLPKQERNLMVKMSAAAKGDINCQAWVTFTGSSAMRIKVREPKLMIKASAPEKVMVGDGCTFTLTVSNPGDHPADQVEAQHQD